MPPRASSRRHLSPTPALTGSWGQDRVTYKDVMCSNPPLPGGLFVAGVPIDLSPVLYLIIYFIQCKYNRRSETAAGKGAIQKRGTQRGDPGRWSIFDRRFSRRATLFNFRILPWHLSCIAAVRELAAP